MRAARAQSSISRSRIATIPPAASSVPLRTSMQPPAAAASGRLESLTRKNGYSFWKKKTNGGASSPLPKRMASQAHHQRYHVESFALALGHQATKVGRMVFDVGIG